MNRKQTMVAACYKFPPEKGIPQTAGNLCCIEYRQPLGADLYQANVYAAALIAVAGPYTVIIQKEQCNSMLSLSEICYLASAQIIAHAQPALLDKEQQRFGGFLLAIKRTIDPHSFLAAAMSVAFALASPETMVISHEEFSKTLPLLDWERYQLLFH
jgi:hypothetical protein